jgi:hypothetical protein
MIMTRNARHWVAGLSIGLGLTGCGSADQLTGRVLGGFGARAHSAAVTMAEDAPRIYVTIPGRHISGAMGMISDVGGVSEWRSADGIGLTLRGGQIIATRGFGADLLIADTSAAATAVKQGHGKFKRPMRHLDGENHDVLRVFDCVLGPDTAQPDLGQRALTETCSDLLGSFRNHYKLSTVTQRLVWSEQWVSDGMGSVVIQSR